MHRSLLVEVKMAIHIDVCRNINVTRRGLMLIIPWNQTPMRHTRQVWQTSIFHFAKYQVLQYNNKPIIIIQCTRCHACHVPSLVWIRLRIGEISVVVGCRCCSKVLCAHDHVISPTDIKSRPSPLLDTVPIEKPLRLCSYLIVIAIPQLGPLNRLRVKQDRTTHLWNHMSCALKKWSSVNQNLFQRIMQT